MPFDDHTGTECRTEPETYCIMKHIIGTPDISGGRNIDSSCRGSGRRSVPNGDVVPQTEPQTQASRKTDLNVHSVPHPDL
jgi:hypothetical protein